MSSAKTPWTAPNSKRSSVHDNLFARGAILRLALNFGEGNVDKYVVVVGANRAPTTLYLLATSQVAKYADGPRRYLPHVKIDAGEVQAFPVSTVIDCNEVRALASDSVVAQHVRGKLRHCGFMSPALMAKIDHCIRSNIRIASNTKALVLPTEDQIV